VYRHSSKASHEVMRSCARSCIAVYLLASLISACSAYRLSPEEGTGARYPESGYRTVVAGDTLYSIAWDSGRDYHELARWNGIHSPYVLHPGQKIRLFPPRGAAASTAEIIVVKPGDTLSSLADDAGVNYQELARWNDIGPPYVIHPGQRLHLAPRASQRPTEGRGARSGNNAAAADSPPATPPPAPSSAERSNWVWPADGTIVGRYRPGSASKGLDIAGTQGEAIRAAAPGQVVYTGGGLRGYGQLIIVKHNRDFLSAYAHCDRIYVAEGDVIKGGQKIAAMGNSGTNRVKLHFEIRYRGSPVDPLKYLPKR
jgi:lipoprotein NlpD